MADTSGINNLLTTQTVDSKSSSAATSKKGGLGQEDFMKLLITQMSYQNPLEPQDNGEFIAQMAQFGTVDGIQKLEESFASLSQALQSNQALQASTLVGRKVEVRANAVEIQDNQAVEGSVEIDTPAQNVILTLVGPNGEEVKKVGLGYAEPGFVKFSINTDANNNPLPAGVYSVRAEAQVGNEVVAEPTYIAANVDSVTLGKGGSDLTLSLAGLGQARMEDIRQIS